MRYWIGPYVWELVPFAHWRSPVGTVGALDLRPRVDRETQAIASGVGFFATGDSLDLGYTLLGQGDLRALSPSTKARRDFATALGLGTLNGATLVECLWDALTVQADPVSGRNPLIPTTSRVLELHLGGHSLVMSKPFSLEMPEAQNVKLVLQEDYRAIEAMVRKGETQDQELNRKVLGYWGLKYGVSDPENYFVPQDMVKVTAVEPTTTITESFNTADSDTLGPDLTWTEDGGDLDIVSNQASHASGSTHSIARPGTALSSADHYAQASCQGQTGTEAPCPSVVCRKADSATLTYYLCQADIGANRIRLFKREAGGFTNIADLNSAGISEGVAFTLKGQVNGSTLSAYVNGAQVGTNQTDGAISGNLKTGIAGFRASGTGAVTLDSFEAADLAAASTNALLLLLPNLRSNLDRLGANLQ